MPALTAEAIEAAAQPVPAASGRIGAQLERKHLCLVTDSFTAPATATRSAARLARSADLRDLVDFASRRFRVVRLAKAGSRAWAELVRVSRDDVVDVELRAS